jgi:HAMP domain-containing protein
VGVRLLTGFTTALLVTSFIVAALAAPAGERTRAFERAFLISLLAAPALGLSVAVPLLRNILKPIQDLIVGTTRVARGDLEVQAAVTSIDEFGELAVSFNEMVAGLRDRRALREYNTAWLGSCRRRGRGSSPPPMRRAAGRARPSRWGAAAVGLDRGEARVGAARAQARHLGHGEAVGGAALRR